MLICLILLNSVFFYSQHAEQAVPAQTQKAAIQLEELLHAQLPFNTAPAARNQAVLKMAQQFHSDMLELQQYLDGNAALLSSYDASNVPTNLIERYASLLEDETWSRQGIAASSEVIARYKAAAEYPSFLQTLRDQASSALALPIFSDPHSFSGRNLQKTLEDFSGLEAVQPLPAQQKGIDAVNQFYPSDVLTILGILLLCMQSFEQDKRYRMQSLLFATPRGRRRLCFVRVLCITVCAIAYLLVLQFCNLALAANIYTLPPLDIPVQSILSFRNTPFLWNLGQYIALFLVSKIAAAISCVLIITCLSYLFHQKNTAIVFSCALYGLCFLMWMYLPQNPLGYIFRYLNPFGVFDSYTILADYQNLNILGFPVSLSSAALLTIAAVCLLCSVYLLRQCNTPRSNEGFLHRFTTLQIPGGHCASSNQFLQECYTLFWTKKCILYPILLFLFMFSQIQWENYDIGSRQITYRNLIDQYGAAPLTEQQCEEIEQRWKDTQNITQLKQELQKDLENHTITESEFEKQRTYLFVIDQERDGFEQFYQQYLYLKQQNNDVYMIQWDHMQTILFKGYDRAIAAILFMACLVAGLSFQYDPETLHMSALIRSTAHGRLYYLWMRAGVAGLYSMLLLLSILLPHWISMVSRYGTEWHGFSLYSIPEFSSFPAALSIDAYFILSILLALLLSAFVGSGLSMLYSMLSSQFAHIAVGVLFLVFPSLLMYIASLRTTLLSAFQTAKFLEPLLSLYTPFTDIHTVLSSGKWYVFVFWFVFFFIHIVALLWKNSFKKDAYHGKSTVCHE